MARGSCTMWPASTSGPCCKSSTWYPNARAQHSRQYRWSLAPCSWHRDPSGNRCGVSEAPSWPCSSQPSPLTVRPLAKPTCKQQAAVQLELMLPAAAISPSVACTPTSRRALVRCRAGGDEARLTRAAANFVEGLKQGVDEDELVALELGADSADQLSNLQEKYKDKIKQKLAERAEEAEREKAEKQRIFTLGKYAYEKGLYPQSVEFLEKALNEEGPFSFTGGEVQLWLALAYQACGRESDAIDTYKRLEDTHPMPRIKRQAAGLRYILEAPKLTLGDDEKVKIPVLTDIERPKSERAPYARMPMPTTVPKRKKTWEEEFFDNYRPPQWVRNYYVWVAASVVGTGLALYSVYARTP